MTAGIVDVPLPGVLVATGTVLDADPQLNPMEWMLIEQPPLEPP